MKTITLQRKIRLSTQSQVALIFFSGVLMGMLLVSLGWAAGAMPQAQPGMGAKRPLIPLQEYSDPTGLYVLKYPAHWLLKSRPDAMVIKNRADGSDRVIFGIVKRPASEPNGEAIIRELESPNRPKDLVRSSARVAGMPAIKLAGTSRTDPSAKMVEYYLQNENGEQFYILMIAPREEWMVHYPKFATMLQTLTFN